MKNDGAFGVREAKQEDVSVIDELITGWLNFNVNREESIRRAIKNKELYVAEHKGRPIGLVHFVKHEDIIDGGPNFFIAAFYVVPEYQRKGVGSSLLKRTIDDALERGALGVEASTANPDARRLYEKHCFEQFMGKWTTGEVFLELNMPKYKEGCLREVGNLGLTKQRGDGLKSSHNEKS